MKKLSFEEVAIAEASETMENEIINLKSEELEEM